MYVYVCMCVGVSVMCVSVCVCNVCVRVCVCVCGYSPLSCDVELQISRKLTGCISTVFFTMLSTATDTFQCIRKRLS